MATSGSSQRKKRAWRKPREEIGPGTVDLMNEEERDSIVPMETSHHKPLRLNRTALHNNSGPDVRDTVVSANDRDMPPAKDKRHTRQRLEATEQSPLKKGGGGTESLERSITDDGTATSDKSVASGAGIVSVSRGAAVVDPSHSSGTGSALVIDGSMLEGGGQILRNTMAMSCLLSRPVTITRIRAGRGNPGLRPQHLTGIELLSELCGGTLVGGGIGSSEITFTPQAIKGGDFTADAKTAGSVCLMLQAALPCLLFASGSSKVTLRGGTNADMAPPIDYTMKVFQPIALRFGVQFDCKLVRRGFFPKGRGEVIISTPTGPIKHLNPVTMTDPGALVKIKIHAYVAGAVPPKMSRQMVHAARKVFEKQLPGVTIDVDEVQETRSSAFGNSSGIIAVAESSTGCLFAGSANGRKSDPPEKTGKAAADELVKSVRGGGCVDEHLQDQLIIFMALAKGTSVIRTGPLTLHTETAIHIANLMTAAKFKVQKVGGVKGEVNLIQCEGIGLENKFKDKS